MNYLTELNSPIDMKYSEGLFIHSYVNKKTKHYESMLIKTLPSHITCIYLSTIFISALILISSGSYLFYQFLFRRPIYQSTYCNKLSIIIINSITECHRMFSEHLKKNIQVKKLISNNPGMFTTICSFGEVL